MVFSWSNIAEFIGIGQTTLTLYEKCKEANMPSTFKCNPDFPTDIEIDTIIKNFKQSIPNSGERMVIGHFRKLGFCVSRERIRKRLTL